jgi:hypothetical protein
VCLLRRNVMDTTTVEAARTKKIARAFRVD